MCRPQCQQATACHSVTTRRPKTDFWSFTSGKRRPPAGSHPAPPHHPIPALCWTCGSIPPRLRIPVRLRIPISVALTRRSYPSPLPAEPLMAQVSPRPEHRRSGSAPPAGVRHLGLAAQMLASELSPIASPHGSPLQSPASSLRHSSSAEAEAIKLPVAIEIPADGSTMPRPGLSSAPGALEDPTGAGSACAGSTGAGSPPAGSSAPGSPAVGSRGVGSPSAGASSTDPHGDGELVVTSVSLMDAAETEDGAPSTSPKLARLERAMLASADSAVVEVGKPRRPHTQAQPPSHPPSPQSFSLLAHPKHRPSPAPSSAPTATPPSRAPSPSHRHLVITRRHPSTPHLHPPVPHPDPITTLTPSAPLHASSPTLASTVELRPPHRRLPFRLTPSGRRRRGRGGTARCAPLRH